jgi:hypothetical protein
MVVVASYRASANPETRLRLLTDKAPIDLGPWY